MNYCQRFFGHLKTILKHKFWVAYYCFHAGIPWQGIVHDMSKFSPTEFFEGVKYYTGTVSPIITCKKLHGHSMAWFHHRGRNYHHYEMWQDNFDNGGQPVEVPYKYAVEMVCDYLAAGKAYHGKDFTFADEYEWWKVKRSKPIAMHRKTMLFIDMVLWKLREENSLDPLRPERLKAVYSIAHTTPIKEVTFGE